MLAIEERMTSNMREEKNGQGQTKLGVKKGKGQGRW